jgi:ABC-type oligopeptide transport system substrate-binding subunit
MATFDPAIMGDAAAAKAITMTFTGLVGLNDNAQVYGQMARSWEVSDDGLTWTFSLKPDLKFSDGSPLTAADVVYSIDRAFDPSLKNASAPFYLGIIKGTEKRADGSLKSLINYSLFAPDDHTVKIVTRERAPYFLQALTFACSWVVNKKLVEKYGNQRWTDHINEGGGAGPFTVERYVHGKEIVLVPNANYYGTKPLLKKVVIPFYPDSKSVFKAYEAGQVSEAEVQTADLARARSLKNQLHRAEQLTTFYYQMNYLAVPFNNIKVRQAFALAIDKDKIAHNVYKDKIVPTNHFVPKGQLGYNEKLVGPAGVASTKGDPAKARQLFEEGLKELNLTRKSLPRIVFTVSTGGSPDMKNEAQAVQAMWKDVLGVEVTINDMDGNQLRDYIQTARKNPKGPMIWATSWVVDYPDPQDWLDLFLDDSGDSNVINYAHNASATNELQKKTQELIRKADTTMKESERLPMYYQAEQQVIDDVAALPIYQGVTNMVRKPCVVGVVDNALTMIMPEDWGKIYISNDTPCANTSAYSK